MLEYIKAVFDLLKGIAWPVAIIGIAYYFKNDIGKIIPRIAEASITGVKFRPPTEQQDASVQLERASVGLPTNSTIEFLMATINKETDQLINDNKVPTLKHAVAYWQSIAFFENTFSLIWGSQISALELLEKHGKIKRADASHRFDIEVKPLFDVHNLAMDFDKWSWFLLRRSLVSLENDEFEITDRGKDFLKYIRDQGFALNKGL